MTTALLLSGGGARGAYQVGAIKALAEISKELEIQWPFPILTGISAGAINSSFLAAHASQGEQAAKKLQLLWEGLNCNNVYKTDFLSLTMNSFSIFKQLTLGGYGAQFDIGKGSKTSSLLDTEPLKAILKSEINFKNIQKNIDEKKLKGLAVTAVDYSTGISRVFYQADGTVKPWTRMRRVGEAENICIEHVMASAAIPILFPPVKVGSSYMADGDLRNYAPLSPAIHLGAERILMIGVKKNERPVLKDGIMPSPARILSVILNSILLDVFDMDYERLCRINQTLGQLPPGQTSDLRPIDVMMIHPSQDIGHLAAKNANDLPITIRHFIKGLGTKDEAADLISYMLFSSKFITELIEMGYEDTLREKDKLKKFLRP